MGYTTEFSGHITIVPPLNVDEIAYLKKFNSTRRMQRTKGPYFVDGTGVYGQGRDADIVDYNQPAQGQPNLWCKWVPSDDGKSISWDGNEKFYDASEWMQYLIGHFLKPTCVAKSVLPFLQANHAVDGEIEAQGEDPNDRWILIVKDNIVTVKRGRTVYK
jgi:hypothetical protein